MWVTPDAPLIDPETGAGQMNGTEFLFSAPQVVRTYLAAQGVKSVLVIPLCSKGQVNGMLSFRFTGEVEVGEDELEIARALATHASLAIQLTQLAKTARESAVLEERNRLASEIHDSLAQTFAGISMQLSVAARALAKKSKEARNHVESANELARFGLSEARRSALSLRSNIIEESGLIEALRKLAECSNIPGLIGCTFQASRVDEKALSPQVQQDLLRIGQEAISNTLRHAQPTIVMTTYETEEDVRRALQAGAKSYLVKGALPEQILEIVRRVAAGDALVPSRIASMLTESLGRAELSARELQVLRQLAEGNSNKEIGRDLKITEHTVKAHVKSILVKLGAAGRTEAVAIARKRGLIRGG
jgi:DNA-binding NarL/FixJ family response regulator